MVTAHRESHWKLATTKQKMRTKTKRETLTNSPKMWKNMESPTISRKMKTVVDTTGTTDMKIVEKENMVARLGRVVDPGKQPWLSVVVLEY